MYISVAVTIQPEDVVQNITLQFLKFYFILRDINYFVKKSVSLYVIKFYIIFAQKLNVFNRNAIFRLIRLPKYRRCHQVLPSTLLKMSYNFTIWEVQSQNF